MAGCGVRGTRWLATEPQGLLFRQDELSSHGHLQPVLVASVMDDQDAGILHQFAAGNRAWRDSLGWPRGSTHAGCGACLGNPLSRCVAIRRHVGLSGPPSLRIGIGAGGSLIYEIFRRSVAGLPPTGVLAATETGPSHHDFASHGGSAYDWSRAARYAASHSVSC